MTGIESLLVGVLTAGKAAAKKGALKKVIEVICSAGTEKTRRVLKKLSNEKQISRLYTQLNKVRFVKTLGQLDKAVDLGTFFCPAHVFLGRNGKKF